MQGPSSGSSARRSSHSHTTEQAQLSPRRSGMSAAADHPCNCKAAGTTSFLPAPDSDVLFLHCLPPSTLGVVLPLTGRAQRRQRPAPPAHVLRPPGPGSRRRQWREGPGGLRGTLPAGLLRREGTQLQGMHLMSVHLIEAQQNAPLDIRSACGGKSHNSKACT